MPLRAFLRLVAEQGQVSIITDEGLENRLVTFEVKDIRADKVLTALARRLNVAVSRDGDLFHIGTIRPEDRAVFITNCARLKAEEAKETVKTVMSKDGKCLTFQDGLIIIADKVELIGKIASLIERIKEAKTDTWVVQFQIINYSHNSQNELGLDASGNFGLAVAASENTEGIGLQISRAISSGKARLITQPLMLIEDGTSAKLSDGETIPIPQKTVSAEGTVTTTGVSYKSTGTSLDVYIRDMGDGLARLTVKVDISNTTGYVEGFPITKGQTSEFTTAISAGRPYLVCNMSQDFESKEKSFSLSGMLGDVTGNAFSLNPNKSDQKNNSLTQIWVRAYKIGGMTNENVQHRRRGHGASVDVRGMEGARVLHGDKRVESGAETGP
jgi:type II secretory pathway component GspD/PulD (secretin)